MHVYRTLGIRDIHGVARRIRILRSTINIEAHAAAEAAARVVDTALIVGVHQFVEVERGGVDVCRGLSTIQPTVRITRPAPDYWNALLEDRIPGINPLLLAHFQEVGPVALIGDCVRDGHGSSRVVKLGGITALLGYDDPIATICVGNVL